MTTACVFCKHWRPVECGYSLCVATRKKDKFDYLSGRSYPVYAEARDVNDGNCLKFSKRPTLREIVVAWLRRLTW